MADGDASLNPWVEIEVLRARVAELERVVTDIRRNVSTTKPSAPAPSAVVTPKGAASRQRTWRTEHPEKVEAYNRARREARAAKRLASVTPSSAVTPTVTPSVTPSDGVTAADTQNTEEKAGSALGVTPVTPPTTAVTPSRGVTLGEAEAAWRNGGMPGVTAGVTVAAPLCTPPSSEASKKTTTTTPVTETVADTTVTPSPSSPLPPTTLTDGTTAAEALWLIANASGGSFLQHAGARDQQTALRLLVEHGCTRAMLEGIGRAIARGPKWSKIRGKWTVQTLIGRADKDGEHRGRVIASLLADEADHAVQTERDRRAAPAKKTEKPVVQGTAPRPRFLSQPEKSEDDHG